MRINRPKQLLDDRKERQDTGTRMRKQQIALCGEVTLEEALEL
jgi:hypothetical protein